MNILHVLDQSLPNVSGYSIRSQSIIKNQVELGLKPIALTSERQGSNSKVETFDNVIYFRTPQKNFNKISKVPFVREYKEIKHLAAQIIRILNENEIDIIHAHSPCIWGIAAKIAARKTNTPIIYEIRAFWEDAAVNAKKYRKYSFKYKFVKILETFLLFHVDHITVISHGIKNELIKRYVRVNKITVVPNGVDLNKFRLTPKNRLLINTYNLNNKFIVGYIGSFFNYEGLEILIKAIKKLKLMKRDIVLLLVGTGEDEVLLKNMVRILELDSEVVFTGKVFPQNVLEYYSIMDILVYPRRSERITELVTPLKPLEAMAMQKCVILSNIGGHKELVTNDDCVVFFENANIDDLVDKIMVLIDQPLKVKSIGTLAYNYVNKNKMWSTIVEAYLPIYKKLMR